MKTKIETKEGLKIVVEGTLEDIKNLIEYLNYAEEKRKSKKNLARVTGISITNELIKMVQKGFFDKPKIFKEISHHLINKGIKVASTTLHPVLSHIILKNKLKRKRNKEGLWEYKKWKNERR